MRDDILKRIIEEGIQFTEFEAGLGVGCEHKNGVCSLVLSRQHVFKNGRLEVREPSLLEVVNIKDILQSILSDKSFESLDEDSSVIITTGSDGRQHRHSVVKLSWHYI